MFEGLYGGWTRYDGNTIYYIGDGANNTISIPAGKTIQSVVPAYVLTPFEKNPEVAEFDLTPVMGEQVTITLRDDE